MSPKFGNSSETAFSDSFLGSWIDENATRIEMPQYAGAAHSASQSRHALVNPRERARDFGVFPPPLLLRSDPP